MGENRNDPGSLFPEVSTEGLKDEPHGPLIHFSLNYSSNGMMAGTGSFGGTSLDWNRDGSITLTESSNGGGKSVRSEYRVKPGIAQKMRDYVEEKHLAALSKMEIRTPEVYDCFTSTSFSMEFDNSALGGSSYETCHVNCGAAGMTFRTIENELSAILKECRETGECIFSEEKQTGGAFGGFFGMMGSTMPMDMNAAPPVPAPKPETPSADTAKEPLPGCWTCQQCGYNGNTGKFCAECGSRR